MVDIHPQQTWSYRDSRYKGVRSIKIISVDGDLIVAQLQDSNAGVIVHLRAEDFTGSGARCQLIQEADNGQE